MITRHCLPFTLLVGFLMWPGCAEKAAEAPVEENPAMQNQGEKQEATEAPQSNQQADNKSPEQPSNGDEKKQTPPPVEEKTTIEEKKTIEEKAIVIEPTHGQLGPGEKASLKPPADAEPFVRPRRRMQITQLDVAIRKASGGIGWTEGTGSKEKNLFMQLKATLGVPELPGCS